MKKYDVANDKVIEWLISKERGIRLIDEQEQGYSGASIQIRLSSAIGDQGWSHFL